METKKHSSLEIKKAAIKAHLSGITAEKVSKIFNISISTFFVWLGKYRKNNKFDDLKNEHGGGSPYKISDYWANRLLKLILNPASNYGFEDDLWSTSRIASLVKRKFNMDISSVTIWRILKRYDFFLNPPKKYMSKGLKKSWISG